MKDYPPEFLCLPFLVWAAFRFGPREAATGALILAGIATWGTVRGFGPVARLIERTRALEASEARLLEAQEVARIGSWEWDVGRNALWWSAELCRIYGLELPHHGPVVGMHPLQEGLVAGRGRLGVVATALGDGRPFAFDHRISRPDGSVRTLAARGRVLLDPEGRAVRLVGTGQDITDRKRAEEARTALAHERAARREAEEASRLKDQFLAMLGHELRNPLGAIASAAAVLDAAGQPDDRTVRAQQVIARQVQHLARMMDDLLDVGRVTTDRQRALEAGFDAHLVKPVDLEALARVLAVPIPRAGAR